jgi:hypothetical protein
VNLGQITTLKGYFVTLRFCVILCGFWGFLKGPPDDWGRRKMKQSYAMQILPWPHDSIMFKGQDIQNQNLPLVGKFGNFSKLLRSYF